VNNNSAKNKVNDNFKNVDGFKLAVLKIEWQVFFSFSIMLDNYCLIGFIVSGAKVGFYHFKKIN